MPANAKKPSKHTPDQWWKLPKPGEEVSHALASALYALGYEVEVLTNDNDEDREDGDNWILASWTYIESPDALPDRETARVRRAKSGGLRMQDADTRRECAEALERAEQDLAEARERLALVARMDKLPRGMVVTR